MPTITRSITTEHNQTLHQRINELPPRLKQIVQYMNIPIDGGHQIYQDMISKTLLCASDGSLKDNIASYSYRILEPKSSQGIQGGGICYGQRDKLSSLRAELFGALALIILLNTIIQTFDQRSDNLEYWVYIDNSEVIRRINNTKPLRLTDYYAPEYELSEEINSQLQMTNAKGHWLWVESHTEAQDQASTMNRYVDKLAEQICLQNTNNLHEEIFPSNRATLFYNNEIINTKVYDHLQNNISNLTLRKYLQRKYAWTDDTFQDVNWNALQCALQSIPLTQRISLIN